MPGNYLAISVTALVLSACATTNPASLPANATRCVDPRPQICTMDYTPVCAERCTSADCRTRSRQTYSNACSACADPLVVFHQPDTCPG